jgi:hypothetical protein
MISFTSSHVARHEAAMAADRWCRRFRLAWSSTIDDPGLDRRHRHAGRRATTRAGGARISGYFTRLPE